MSWERHGGLRAAITQLAAQIMYGEDVKQYFTAKRLAAKRLREKGGVKALRARPQDLPSNGEIKAALLELVTEIEGDARTQRLFAMRIVALEAMEAMPAFQPRLIGSVATGHVRRGSDIDIHVFAWDAADVEAHVRALGWVHETQRVSILKHGRVMEFTHVHVPDVFPIELTVYPPNELRNRPRSSTDGKPIVRIRDSLLRALCAKEHAELWARYLRDGATPSLADILAAEEADAEGDAGSLDAIVDAPWVDEDAEASLDDLTIRDPWDDDASLDRAGDLDEAHARDFGEPDEHDAIDGHEEPEPRIRRIGSARARDRRASDRRGGLRP